MTKNSFEGCVAAIEAADFCASFFAVKRTLGGVLPCGLHKIQNFLGASFIDPLLALWGQYTIFK